jgi:hypothetical protein
MDGLSGRTFNDELLRLDFTRGEIVFSTGCPGGLGKYPWTLNAGSDPPQIDTPTGFGIFREPCVTRVYFPNWLATSLAAVVAILPWIRLSNRFSLRALLIATTLIAVLLGTWAALRLW